MSMANKWTKEEELSLLENIGNYGFAKIQAELNTPYFWLNDSRSISAIYSKLRRMGFNGGLTRGGYTLRFITENTGYNKTHIKRAAKALRQKWKKTSSLGAYIITYDQYEEICNWLKLDYWSKLHKIHGCLWCSTHDKPHKCYGLCVDCMKVYNKFLSKYKMRGLARIRTKLVYLYKMRILPREDYFMAIRYVRNKKAFSIAFLRRLEPYFEIGRSL
jgi:hypothetical protein